MQATDSERTATSAAVTMTNVSGSGARTLNCNDYEEAASGHSMLQSTVAPPSIRPFKDIITGTLDKWMHDVVSHFQQEFQGKAEDAMLTLWVLFEQMVLGTMVSMQYEKEGDQVAYLLPIRYPACISF